MRIQPVPCFLDCREGALQSQQYGDQSFGTARGNAVKQSLEPLHEAQITVSAVQRGMSAAMQRSLLRLARQQRAVLAAGERAYASAAELAVAQDSPFLRFASPEPHPVSYGSLLGQIPETQVGGCPAFMFGWNQERIDLNCTGHGVQNVAVSIASSHSSVLTVEADAH